ASSSSAPGRASPGSPACAIASRSSGSRRSVIAPSSSRSSRRSAEIVAGSSSSGRAAWRRSAAHAPTRRSPASARPATRCHPPRVLWMTGQKALPVLIVDGETIHDSTRIIERLERLRPEPALYPADDAERRRALALEDFFDEELGPHVRRALFHELLPETE